MAHAKYIGKWACGSKRGMSGEGMKGGHDAGDLNKAEGEHRGPPMDEDAPREPKE